MNPEDRWSRGGEEPATGSPWASRIGTTRDEITFSARDQSDIRQGLRTAQRTVLAGVLWLAVGVVLTAGSLIVAPGGYLLLCFGPIGGGVLMIVRGIRLRSAVSASAESLPG